MTEKLTSEEIRAATLELANINKRLGNIRDHNLPESDAEQDYEDAAKLIERLTAKLIPRR